MNSRSRNSLQQQLTLMQLGLNRLGLKRLSAAGRRPPSVPPRKRN
ncbi:hypothetical protein [Synechococcus sp. MIT S9504]|nr:hypothetical protein [Synechococcus sp. MIT S9504]